jgi:type II secretory pathway pseudopilin PulG
MTRPSAPTSRPRGSRARANARPRGEEGFTLIELTVSLVAGLIVAMGIVGLSRDATHTFHEEMRSAAAEANLRTAIDRLRADLARAGYMTTGNVILDPLIAKLPGAVTPIPAGFLGLGRLSSIYLQQGGSLVETPLSAQQTSPMTPDMIDIAGNMTSTDQYVVDIIQPGGGSGGCTRIFMNGQSPSMYRILGLGAAGASELNNLFQPTTNSASQFIVRLVDKTSHSQFLATCPGVQPTGIAAAPGTGTPEPYVDIDPLTPVQTALATGTVGGLNGYGSGSLVNPVQIVRWQLMAAANEPAQYVASPLGHQPLTGNAIDPTKYDLVRSYIDAQTGNVVPGTTEIVAEYAVDLEFAFSVDAGTSTLLPIMQTFPFDSAAKTGNNAPWAPNIVVTPPVAFKGSEMIRSVRVRLVTRAAEPDRTLDVPVPNPTPPFTYRYCVLPGGCDPMNLAGVLQYARARTVTAEVALPNQSRNYY